MVKNKLKQDSDTYSIDYGAKQYAFISLHYHIRKYGTKPYTPIPHNCHIKKLFDTFFKLSNDLKSVDISSVEKNRFSNFSLTLHLFDDVDRSMYILWLINSA